MPIDRDIQSLVRREAAKFRNGMDADTLFTSPEYRKYTEDLIFGFTLPYGIRPRFNLYFGELDGCAAFTTGQDITQNLHCGIVYQYENLLNKFLCQIGITMHETAHILYHDFNADLIARKKLENGELPCHVDDSNESAEFSADLLEMESALEKEAYRPIFVQIFDSITNAIDDPHDEDKLMENYGQLVTDAISMLREALLLECDSFEQMQESGKSELSIAFSLLLQYIRFYQIVAIDTDAAYQSEIMQRICQFASDLEFARYTDSPAQRFQIVCRIMVFLWPYIKKTLDEEEQKQQSQQNQQNQQGQQGQQGGDPSQGGQNGQGQQNQPQNGSGQGSQGTHSQQAIQNVMSQLNSAAQQSGQTQAVQNGKTSNAAKAASKAANQGKQAPKQDPAQKQGQNSASSANGLPEKVLGALMDSISAAEGAASVQDSISKAVGGQIHAVDQNSTHKGVRLGVKDHKQTTDEDKKLYEKMMQDVSPYSKRLQKRMQEALRDLKDGSVAHHKAMGKKFEPSAAYRPDEHYFCTRKLPQDLPDMAISVLVDHSGSMHGPRIEAAMKGAMLLYDFATHLDIPVCVSGHCTSGDEVVYHQYTNFRKVAESEKFRLAQMRAGGCNRDGMAIEIAANLLAQRPEEVKLLIVISDGQPNHSGYGGSGASEDIRSILKRYRKRGVESVAAAIGDDKENIKDIYGEGYFLDIADLEKLPKTLVSLVRKKIVSQ